MNNSATVTVTREDMTVTATIEGTDFGGVCILAEAVNETGYYNCEGEEVIEKYILIERVDVEGKRKGIYTAIIDFLVENLEENEKLVSKCRSEESNAFWNNSKWNADVDEVAQDEQDQTIVIDYCGDLTIEDSSEFYYIDFC